VGIGTSMISVASIAVSVAEGVEVVLVGIGSAVVHPERTSANPIASVFLLRLPEACFHHRKCDSTNSGFSRAGGI